MYDDQLEEAKEQHATGYERYLRWIAFILQKFYITTKSGGRIDDDN